MSQSITMIAMTLLLLSALGLFAVLVGTRLKLLLKAKPDDRFDRWGERVLSAVKFAIGQWRMPRDPIAGVAHIFIFSGFMVLTVATVTHFVNAYIPGARLPGRLGDVYSLIKDIFETLVIIAVVYSLWRRLGPKLTRVGRSAEGVFVLFMILTLMVTDFMVYGGEIVVQGTDGLPWNPGGHVAALLMAPLGKEAAHLIGVAAYWVHCIAVLVFLNFLPIGKHFHVITGIPKVFFRNLKPWGQVPAQDIEAAFENEEPIGVRTTGDLSWSMVLDLYSCTECGRCTVFCPTSLTGKPLAHRQLNLDLKAALYADKEVLLSGDKEKIEGLDNLVGNRIDPETIWACTTCGSCEQECPIFIENIPRIIEMRKQQVLLEEAAPGDLARAYKGMEQNSNPWGLGFDQRDAWAEGLDVTRMADWASMEGADKDNPPLLYWVGCAGSFDDRNKKITQAMVKILKAAKVPFAILGKEEGCTGDSARRSGNEYLFQMLAQQNIELLNQYGVKKVLTHCPHCMHTIKTEYPQFGGDYEVVHHTTFIEELLGKGQLALSGKSESKVAFHDSCYLGRYHDIYDAPRNVIKSVPGAQLVELPRKKSRSVCCGAGGGRFWMEETIGERINAHRAKEAVETGGDTIGSSCPFCLTMLKDGVADLGHEEAVKTKDLAEIVAEAL